jgi:hypothetical protein
LRAPLIGGEDVPDVFDRRSILGRSRRKIAAREIARARGVDDSNVARSRLALQDRRKVRQDCGWGALDGDDGDARLGDIHALAPGDLMMSFHARREVGGGFEASAQRQRRREDAEPRQRRARLPDPPRRRTPQTEALLASLRALRAAADIHVLLTLFGRQVQIASGAATARRAMIGVNPETGRRRRGRPRDGEMTRS